MLKTTSTARLKRQCTPSPSTAFASHEHHDLYYNLRQSIMSDIGTQRPNWSNRITLTNKTTAEDITSYIKFKMNEYTEYNFKDKSLWESYQEDFDNFEVQTFKDANRLTLKGLKQLLRRNGVWVFDKKSKSVPQALYDVAHEDDRTE